MAKLKLLELLNGYSVSIHLFFFSAELAKLELEFQLRDQRFNCLPVNEAVCVQVNITIVRDHVARDFPDFVGLLFFDSFSKQVADLIHVARVVDVSVVGAG